MQAQHSQEPGELLGCCLRGVSTEILHELRQHFSGSHLPGAFMASWEPALIYECAPPPIFNNVGPQ